jgi:hypothetical protein
MRVWVVIGVCFHRACLAASRSPRLHAECIVASHEVVTIRPLLETQFHLERINLNIDIVILALVYASPFIAFFLIRKLKKKTGKTPPWLIGACAFVLLMACVLPLTSNSFTTRPGNLLFCTACLFAYCCITMVVWHLRDVGARAGFGILVSIPLLVTYAIIFMITDFSHGRIWGSSDHGYERKALDHGYACEFSPYQAYLYREWPIFPLIEHEVDMQYRSDHDGTKNPDCEKMMQAYQTRRACESDASLCHQ